MVYNTIYKDTPIEKAKEILEVNGISTPYGWEIIIGMLLSKCDHFKIEGYGSKAEFHCFDENNQPIAL